MEVPLFFGTVSVLGGGILSKLWKAKTHAPCASSGPSAPPAAGGARGAGSPPCITRRSCCGCAADPKGLSIPPPTLPPQGGPPGLAACGSVAVSAATAGGTPAPQRAAGGPAGVGR